MDLFVHLDKIGINGKVAPFVASSMVDDGPLGLGWLRVSHRELVTERSTIDRPWHPYDRQLTLRLNEIVPVDIEILPTSTLFHSGETLRVQIQGNDCFRHSTPDVIQFHRNTVNNGKHYLHTGPFYASYLVTVTRLKFFQLVARARKSQCTHIDNTLNRPLQQPLYVDLLC